MNALYTISALGVIAMFSEIFNFKRWLFPIVMLGLAAAFACVVYDWNLVTDYPLFNNMLKFDRYADAFSGIVILITFLWMLLARHHFSDESTFTDYFALILFSLVGAVVLASFNNLIMLFLGIEILSIPVYVLAGSKKTDVSSNEAAFKYFLMGAFASGILLFGMALIYGASGSFHLDGISAYVRSAKAFPIFFYAGILLILAGLSFKVSAVPFHFWAPDVYQGAPTVITAYMSAVVKTAAIAAFYRIFAGSFDLLGDAWMNILTLIIILTIIIGNLIAVYQDSVKRMMAYSGISHAGFMLMAVLAMNEYSPGALVYYTLTYSLALLLAFAVLINVMQKSDNDLVESFNGLAKKSPLLAFGITAALLSMAGIPPLAGFFAKYYIFAAALKEGYTGLVILAVLGSLVGVYYYFRIIIAMYFRPPAAGEAMDELSGLHRMLIFICLAAILLLGLFPDPVFSIKF